MLDRPMLTDAQRRAVAARAHRMRVLAGAGSGKTEVLARRTVRLLADGAAPSSIVAFTFTEKAAAELKQRIEERARTLPAYAELPPVSQGMFVGTMHAYALDRLRDLGGRYELVDALDETQEWALAYRVARRLGIVALYESVTPKVAAAPAVTAFLHSAEVVSNERIDRGALRVRTPDFAATLERYEWLLDEMRLLPFRLMIARAADELASGGRLRDRLAGRLSHVLVDEFQDLNHAQYALVDGLVATGADLTVVGDDDQAIYQWRGGDVDLLTGIESDLDVALAANHRCRPEVVELAARLVRDLPERLPKALSSSRSAGRPAVVEVLRAADAGDEASRIADRVAALISAGHRSGDIAVLYRSVRTSAKPLVGELRARGIQAMVVGKTSLLAHPEMALVARVLVSWLDGCWYPNPDHTAEPVTRERLLREIAAVTGRTWEGAERVADRLATLGATVRRDGVRDSVLLLDEILAALGLPVDPQQDLGLGQLSALLASFDHAVRQAVPQALYTGPPGSPGLEERDEDRALQPHPEDGRRVLGGSRGEIYLRRLRAYLEEFAGRAAEETPQTRPDTDAVQVMTVHQAKGLEFPIVFVPCLVEGRFPTRLTGRPQHWYVPDDLFDRARYEGREADEARLLYVALTRASELLVVSWFKRHEVIRADPSRFVPWLLRAPVPPAVAPPGTACPPCAPADGQGREPLGVDFSALVTYAACGYRYWLRHVCGFRPPRAPELGFGRMLHHVLAELARRALAGHQVGKDDALDVLDRSWYLPFAGPVPDAKLRAGAAERLERYVAGHGAELNRVVEPERSFEVPLGEARLRGRIDLVLRAEGGGPKDVELIDFKTSAERPPSEMHAGQLRLYAAAMRRLGYRPVEIAIHDLDGAGGRVAVPMDEPAQQAFERRLHAWVADIRAQRFEPTPAACPSCDFRRFCRYTQG